MFKRTAISAAAIFTLTMGGNAAAGLLDDFLGVKPSTDPRSQTLSSDLSCKDVATKGCFRKPFAEPFVYRRTKADDNNTSVKGTRTDEKCLYDPVTGKNRCKPAAGTISLLPTGDFLYFNALEGTEDFEFSILVDFGQKAINDQTRRMSIPSGGVAADKWTRPSPVESGANPDGYQITQLLPGVPLDNSANNGADGALFCADVAMLADGQIMAVGGTAYYSEPGNTALGYGLTELEGLKNSRAYNPNTNSWQQLANMTYGRWYPSIVTLADSKVFVASGVTKLVKPVYPSAPEQSGRNVVQTETFLPPSLTGSKYNACEEANLTGDALKNCKTRGLWKTNSARAERSLPLYPRLHLLPNGHVLYNAGGQAFNPFGQSYDQPLWNIAATYNPGTDSWADLAYGGFPFSFSEAGLDSFTQLLNPTPTGRTEAVNAFSRTFNANTVMKTPAELQRAFMSVAASGNPEKALQQAIGGGMRGSTFSVMMPLRPDSTGKYTEAKFLTAGGVLPGGALASPGAYFATAASRIDTVKTQLADNVKDAKVVSYSSEITGSLNETRWYGTGVLLPDDSVTVFSGGDRDGVAAPGVEFPRKTAERFDPNTKTWAQMAVATNPRTYHNTALLMTDGRVLVGGHAPISTLYLKNINLAQFGFSPNDGRDPSFEIYEPPYFSNPKRPVLHGFDMGPQETDQKTGKPILRDIKLGGTISLKTGANVNSANLDSISLVRHTVMTHLIDADQRTVVIPKDQIRMNGNTLTFKLPEQAAVLPQGAYMIFVRTKDGANLLPSKSVSFMARH